MGEIGDGTGSSYPGSYDTDTSPEVNSPNAGRTRARAEVPKDLAAAILSVQTTLGINPHQSAATVGGFLNQEHTATGAHDDAFVANVSGTQTITGQKTFTGGVNVSVSGFWGTATTAQAGRVAVSGDFFLSGTVPLARMQVDEQNAENAGTVTLTVGSDVTIISLPSMNVTNGDRILVYGSILANKGGTAGVTTLVINKESGGATISVFPSANNVDIKDQVEQPASTSLYPRTISGFVTVTGTGTLVLRLRGYVTGSSTTVTAGDGSFIALVLRGT